MRDPSHQDETRFQPFATGKLSTEPREEEQILEGIQT